MRSTERQNRRSRGPSVVVCSSRYVLWCDVAAIEKSIRARFCGVLSELVGPVLPA